MFIFHDFFDTTAVYVDAIDTSTRCVDIFWFNRHNAPMCRWHRHVKKTAFSYHVAGHVFKKWQFFITTLR